MAMRNIPFSRNIAEQASLVRLTRFGARTVATGPLILMTYSLRAIAKAKRGRYCIRSAAGDLSPAEAEETLTRWMSPVPRS